MEIVVDRMESLQAWVKKQFSCPIKSLEMVSGDASFRQYYRVTVNMNGFERSYIVMDAPPKHEDIGSFVAIADALQQQTVLVPTIFARDLTQGFLLLSDFGDGQLLSVLTDSNADMLYKHAIDELMSWQQINLQPAFQVPAFDLSLYGSEFDLFKQWFLTRHRQLTISDQLHTKLAYLFQCIVTEVQQQPQILVHRDYHSRNIMVCEDNQLGILDFQDAVIGPITYDLVSLLRDCYVDWPKAKVVQWVRYYYDQQEASLIGNVSFEQFLKWFDWTGVQRHLKCLGIFSRLAYRDNKPAYLDSLPRVLNYLDQVTARYDELQWLNQLLGQV